MDHVRLAVQLKAPARRETFLGREHLVVPAVLVQSQVLHNNLGRTFLPAEDITTDWASASNGAPVVIDHPTSRGQPVSARDPGVMNVRGVGAVYNVRVDTGVLKGDVFIDLGRVEQVEGLGVVVANVEAGKPGELSTGFPVIREPGRGVHNGHEFDLTIHPAGPLDHLAVFADKTGACSVKDGCGLGVNHAGPCSCDTTGGDAVDERTAGMFAQAVEKLTALAKKVGVISEADTPDAVPEPAENQSGDHPEEGDPMNREQMIAQLAKAGPLTEAELGKLSEAQLRALSGAEQPAANTQDGDTEAWRIAHEYRRKFEELEARASNAMESEEKERVRLLDDLIYNSKSLPWTDQELKAMEITELRKVHQASFPARKDYTGKGGPRASNTTSAFDFVKPILGGRPGESVFERKGA